MTLSPVPDLAELYPHMSVEMLSRHLDAVVAALAAQGVEMTPVAQVGLEEIAEAIIEHHARHDVPALHRHLALVRPSSLQAPVGSFVAPSVAHMATGAAMLHAPGAQSAPEGANEGAF
jgi:hypothetical protein